MLPRVTVGATVVPIVLAATGVTDTLTAATTSALKGTAEKGALENI